MFLTLNDLKIAAGVSYYALVLDEQSHKTLLEKFEIPDEWKPFAHHMTICLGNNKDQVLQQWIEDNMGKKFEATVIEEGLSDRAKALKVRSEVPSKNELKHITLAVAPGAKPVESNHITEWKPTEHLLLHGTITAVQFAK